jgi:hypothetical protein
MLFLPLRPPRLCGERESESSSPSLRESRKFSDSSAVQGGWDGRDRPTNSLVSSASTTVANFYNSVCRI